MIINTMLDWAIEKKRPYKFFAVFLASAVSFWFLAFVSLFWLFFFLSKNDLIISILLVIMGGISFGILNGVLYG